MKFESYLLGVVDNRGRNPEYYMSLGKYPVIDNYLIKNELYPKISNVKRYIDDNLRNNFIRENVYAGMVLMTLVGEGIGNVTTAPNDQIVIIQNTIGFKVNPKFLNDKYLYYYLKSQNEHIRQFNRGSGQPSIRKTDILGMDVDFPSIECQEKIVDILSCFDEKIENNQRINNNLYRTLMLSFKHDYWDAVKSHPDWSTTTLDEATARFGTGLNPRKNFVLGHGNNYYVTIKNMGSNRIFLDDRCDKIDDEALEKIQKRSDLQVGDLLFSGIGTIGRVYLIDKPANNWNTSESVFNLRPNHLISSEFLYLLLLNDDMQEYAISLASGSVQKGIRMADLKRYKFALPSSDYIKHLSTLWRPMIQKIKANEYENDRLADLRDAVLPKLMSGEIDVSKVEI